MSVQVDAPTVSLPETQQQDLMSTTPPESPVSGQFAAQPSRPGPDESSVTIKSPDSPPEVEVDQDPRDQARAMWRASAAAARPLTGRELGSHFGMSERWGRDRIAEVRRADGIGAAAKAARRANSGKPQKSNENSGPDKQRAESGAPEHGARHAAVVDARLPDDIAAQPDQARSTAPAPAVAAVSVPAGARLVAWAGFLFGTVISVAANVLHAWLPALAGEAAAPGLAVQVGAAVWPIALVISVEVLSRVPWRPGWAWQFARYGGAGVVAIGAAVISYGHLHGVLAAWGYGTTGAAVGPLVVDGLMTISGFALLALGGHGKHGRRNGKEAR